LVDNVRLDYTPPFLAGDYNGDGVVDAADYTVWRDTLGHSVTPGTGADGDNDGVIGPGDYTVWKNNFGQAVGSGSGSRSGTVPEPSSLVLLIMASIGVAMARGRR
jgi:hypothetical protein